MLREAGTVLPPPELTAKLTELTAKLAAELTAKLAGTRS